MPAVAVAAIGAGASLYSANQQKKAAQGAANAQTAADQSAIEEQRRQFDALQELMKPYVQAGTGALGGYQDLLGLNGQGQQSAALSGIENSPVLQALMGQGEGAILQNASATGGLRGGNVQGALGQFRPAMLSQAINDQFSRLGGLVSVGQNAAGGVGNAGMQSGNIISQLMQHQGAAQAGGLLARGQANAGLANTFASGLGSILGSGKF